MQSAAGRAVLVLLLNLLYCTVPYSNCASTHMRYGVISVEGCDLEQQDF